MAWLEFRQRFIPDFEKTYGRLPTEREIADAEASFREYARSKGIVPEDESRQNPPPHTENDNSST